MVRGESTAIYFENSMGLCSPIAELHDSDTKGGASEAALKAIADFLRDVAKYSPPNYYRMWNIDVDGEKRTCIDFGSHAEFFYTYPAVL